MRIILQTDINNDSKIKEWVNLITSKDAIVIYLTIIFDLRKHKHDTIYNTNYHYLKVEWISMKDCHDDSIY